MALTLAPSVSGTADAARLAERRPGLLAEEIEISRFERVNLTVALVVIHLSQVLLVALTLLMFLLLFGTIAMQEEVVEVWIDGQQTNKFPGVDNLSAELLQVAVFLSAFSALYVSVTAATDDTYRSQFFTEVMREMERAIAVRAAYNAVRRDRGDVLEDDPAGAAVEPLGRAQSSPPPPDDHPTVQLEPVEPVEPVEAVEPVAPDRRGTPPA